MGRLVIVVMLMVSITAFTQDLGYMRGFEKGKNGLYEMTFKDVREAIHKYNYVLDMNGSDTNYIIYNVSRNPIDFGYFSNNPNSDNVIVSIFLRDGNKYKIMFTEIDGTEDKYFFDVTDHNGVETELYYRRKR